eukprot:gnl/Spiro4/25436_TR12687_c0_g1_i1.p1 gnl/Spiro4/25436_TR12687_c0_g1~~gnl/Spiro4/25436_TR12687_c0_g1_i1.p1  ORF type:complete len:1239 (-),score=303.72 gnl/Spiro4/25436_TR12687_c0_g1_i1:57-3773(-)
MTVPANMSKDMVDMIKAIGESKTKQEEDRIMTREIQVLKEKMGLRDVTQRRMREYIIRMVYCEMLGHDASFAHSYAVKFTAQNKLLDKKIAYLGVCLCLQPKDELIILMVNTMQRDLKSSNMMEVCAALHACCSLIGEETIPAMLPFVIELLSHASEYVRKKAVMCLHSFFCKAPYTVSHLADRFRHTLCDINPSVMGVSLHMMFELVKVDPSQYKDLVPSLVNILKQIIDHRLHRDYDYHRLPAPWIQIRMLNLLAVLGANDQAASEGMYEILFEVLKRADVSINIGHAIIYETVRTITTIYPHAALLETAASNISRFLTSLSHNLKYLGITGLASIVQIDAKYAQPHQLTVIDCLEDPDETLRRKTLDLLFRMTNVHNVVVVVDKMLGHLKTTTDSFLRRELTSRITALAERYAPSTQWYIVTMNSVFDLGGESVPSDVANNLLRLLAEGSGENEADDDAMRQYAVRVYLEAIAPATATGAAAAGTAPSEVSDLMLRVAAWVLGEYAFLVQESVPLSTVLARLCDLLEAEVKSEETRGWILSAIMKLSVQVDMSAAAVEVIEKYSQSSNLDLQQRCNEFKQLVRMHGATNLRPVFPVDASCEAIQVDTDLRFADAFVADALAHGARSYVPPAGRTSDPSALISVFEGREAVPALRFDAYAQPVTRANTLPLAGVVAGGGGSTGAGSGPLPPYMGSVSNNFARQPTAPAGPGSAAPAGDVLAHVPVKWGFEGYQPGVAPAAPQAPQAGIGAAVGGGGAPGIFSSPSPGSMAPLGSSSSSHYQAPAVVPSSSQERRGSTDSLGRSQPKVLTERERKAAALFGGGSTFSPSTSGPGSAAQSHAAGVARPKHTHTAGHTSGPDLDSLIGGAPTPTNTSNQSGARGAPASSWAGAHASSGSSHRNSFGSSGNSAATSAVAGGGGGGIEDLFGGPTSISTPTTLRPQTHGGAAAAPAPARADLFSFDALLAMPSPQPSSLPFTAPITPIPLGAPSELPSLLLRSELDAFPRHPSPAARLCENPEFMLKYFKVFKPNETVIVVLITNTGSTTASQCSLELSLPSSISVRYGGDPAPIPSSTPNRLGLSSINVRSTCAITIALAPQLQAATAADASLTGALRNGPGALLQFSLPITAGDFIRPLAISTQEYAAKWPSLPAEKKVRVSPTALTMPNDLMTRASSLLNLHPVEVIGMEAITAGQLLDGRHVLMHARMTPGAVDLMIRSPDRTLSEYLAKSCSSALA